MKKLMLSMAIVIIAIVTANAQDKNYPNIELGLKAGANLTQINGQSFNNSFNLNYLLGGYVTFDLSKSFGIQPELEFSQVTATTSSNFRDIYSDFGPAITQNPHLDYMSIPVLLNFGGHFLRVQLGPQFSVLMNNGESFWANGRQAFTNGDIGMDGGLWLNLPLHLDAFARYVVGLKNINDIDNQDTWKSQQIQLGIGLRL